MGGRVEVGGGLGGVCRGKVGGAIRGGCRGVANLQFVHFLEDAFEGALRSELLKLRKSKKKE